MLQDGDIKTVAALQKAIKDAHTIYVQVRFGISETWVKLSKQSARDLISGMPLDATPSHMEMSDRETFGSVRNGFLYLG